jgi:hypothetical protein
VRSQNSPRSSTVNSRAPATTTPNAAAKSARRLSFSRHGRSSSPYVASSGASASGANFAIPARPASAPRAGALAATSSVATSSSDTRLSFALVFVA